MRFVPEHIKKPDYFFTGYPEGELKSKASNIVDVKTPEEIQNMREACILGLSINPILNLQGRKALDLGHSLIKPGVTTDFIDATVHDFIIKSNSYPSPLNYHSFPKSICSFFLRDF
jgi:methionyl aminopeptidase